MELVVRRESFAMRFGGLRYTTKPAARLGNERYAAERVWSFDLDDLAWSDGRGGHFGWTGEHVSSPVRHVIHADGRAGVRVTHRFLEISSSAVGTLARHP
jgi:hypothetical protein